MIRKTDLNDFEIGVWWKCKNDKKSLLERGGKEWIWLYKIGDWYLML